MREALLVALLLFLTAGDLFLPQGLVQSQSRGRGLVEARPAHKLHSRPRPRTGWFARRAKTSPSPWLSAVKYPGAKTWTYPVVRPPSVCTDTDMDEEREDKEGKEGKDSNNKEESASVLEWRPLFQAQHDNALTSTSTTGSADKPRGARSLRIEASLVSDRVTEDSSSLDLSELVQRALRGFRSTSGKYCRLLAVPSPSPAEQRGGEREEQDVLNAYLVSLSRWPIGWRHFAFHSFFAPRKQTKKDAKEDSVTLHVVSVASKATNRKALLTVTLTRDRSDGSLSLSAEMLFQRLREKDARLVAEAIVKELKIATREQYLLSFARKSLLQKFQKATQKRRQQQKNEELDRVLHPEKYQVKKARGERAGAKEGGGRYRPSAAAQARRQVRSR